MLNAVHMWGGYTVEPTDVHASVRHLVALQDMLTSMGDFTTLKENCEPPAPRQPTLPTKTTTPLHLSEPTHTCCCPSLSPDCPPLSVCQLRHVSDTCGG